MRTQMNNVTTSECRELKELQLRSLVVWFSIEINTSLALATNSSDRQSAFWQQLRLPREQYDIST